MKRNSMNAKKHTYDLLQRKCDCLLILPNISLHYAVVWLTVMMAFLPNLTLSVQNYNHLCFFAFFFSNINRMQTYPDLKSSMYVSYVKN